MVTSYVESHTNHPTSLSEWLNSLQRKRVETNAERRKHMRLGDRVERAKAVLALRQKAYTIPPNY